MSMPQSVGFEIVTCLIGVIGAAPSLAALPLVRNPRTAQHLNKGNRVLIVAEKSDSLIEQSGLREKRRRLVTLAALSRRESADADADALYQALSNAAKGSLSALQSAGAVGRLAERDLQFHVDDLDVDGAIVAGGWEIEYVRERPG